MSISTDMSPFRDRLKLAAKHAGVEYSQTAIAQSLGVSKQTVDQWMGDGRPSAEMIYLIADKWKVSPRWLQLDQGEMLPTATTDGKPNPLESDAEKLLALVRTFFDTDSEGRAELVKLARAVVEGHGTTATAKVRGARRR